MKLGELYDLLRRLKEAEADNNEAQFFSITPDIKEETAERVRLLREIDLST